MQFTHVFFAYVEAGETFFREAGGMLYRRFIKRSLREAECLATRETDAILQSEIVGVYRRNRFFSNPVADATQKGSNPCVK